MFFDICLKYPAKKPIICRKTKIWGDWRTRINNNAKLRHLKTDVLNFAQNFQK
jgi:hypothetical protein